MTDRPGHAEARKSLLPVWVAGGGASAIYLYRLFRTWTTHAEDLVAQVPDDAFYYHQIALNIANGAGSTFDGINLTNGYHPIWMMICSSFALILGTDWEMDALLVYTRAMLTVQWMVGMAGIGLLAWSLWRLVRSRAAVAVFLAGCALPWPVYALTDGMESALTWLVLGALLALFARHHPFAWPVGNGDVAFGALLSLLFLSRLDMVFWCFSAGGLVLLLQGPRRGFAKGVVWAVPVFLMGGIYLYLNRLHFDTVVPISGKLKSTFPEPHFFAQWVVGHPVAFAAGAFAAVAGAARLVAVLRGGGQPGLATGGMDSPAGPLDTFLITGAGAIVLHAVYTLLFSDWAVHVWHFTGYWPVALVGAGWVTARFCERFSGSGGGMVWTAIVLMLCAGAASQWLFFRDRRDHAFQVRSYEAAIWTRENLPSAHAIAMSDCGAFGYFRGGLVVNLDGVVNNRAYQDALVEHGLSRYLESLNVEYLAHHAIRAERIPPGYEAYEYSARSRLYKQYTEPLVLREDNEIYRSEPFDDRTGIKHFVIWRIDRPFLRHRPIVIADPPD